MLSWQQQCEHTPPSVPLSCARAGHSSPLQRPVSTHSFSLSFCLEHTQIFSLFLSLCNYFRPTISFLPYFPHTFLHFLFTAALSSPLSFLPSFFPSNKPSISFALPPQLLSHLGLFAWQSVKAADSESRPAEPSCVHPGPA